MPAYASPSGPAWDLAGFQGTSPPRFPAQWIHHCETPNAGCRRPPGCGRLWAAAPSLPQSRSWAPLSLPRRFLPRLPASEAPQSIRPPSGEQRRALPAPPHSSHSEPLVEGQATQGVGRRGAGRGPGKAPFPEQGRGPGQRGSGTSGLAAGGQVTEAAGAGQVPSGGAEPAAPRFLLAHRCLLSLLPFLGLFPS